MSSFSRNSAECLYIADFNVPQKWYANAFHLSECVVTAGHVAGGNLTIIVPGKTEVAGLNFLRHPDRDLAVATYKQTPQGFHLVMSKQSIVRNGETVKRQVIVRGFHGSGREEFQIPAHIIGTDERGRIIIESNFKNKTFQKGMSGSVAELNGTIAVGFLVEGVEGKKGSQAFFEPAWALVPYIANLELV